MVINKNILAYVGPGNLCELTVETRYLFNSQFDIFPIEILNKKQPFVVLGTKHNMTEILFNGLTYLVASYVEVNVYE